MDGSRLNAVLYDVRLGMRMLRRTPAFTGKPTILGGAAPAMNEPQGADVWTAMRLVA
jgi:hypothetical protein